MTMLYHQLIGNPDSKYCLLFIHGALCNGRDWKYQIDYFAKNHQLLVPDLPGHGRSQNIRMEESFGYTIPELAASIIELIKQLAIAKPLILIGHSMSVRVVSEIYFLITPQVHGLAMLDCGYQPVNNLKPNFRTSISQIGYRAWINDFFEQTFTRHTDPEIRKLVLKNINTSADDVGKQLFTRVLDYDYYALTKVLRLIKINTLVIQSTLRHDGKRYAIGDKPELKSEWLSLLKENVEQLQIHAIAQSGHFIMLEKPKLVNKLLDDYICSLS